MAALARAALAALSVCVCAALAAALVDPRGAHFAAERRAGGAYPEQWFTQRLDHFSPVDARTFAQRYYVNSDNVPAKGGPQLIILYINGEGAVAGPPATADSEVVLLAQYFGALIVTLEHRYYGKSVPVQSLASPDMVYLSSKQALFDLAAFAEMWLLKYPGVPLINIGGSYSGALSAWFRLKFPHLTKAAVSSSGVVNAILDFVEFDEQIAESAGTDCAAALRQVTARLEDAWNSNRSGVLAMMQAPADMRQGDFFYLMADAAAESIQYGYHTQMCGPLVAAVQSGADVLQAFASWVLTGFYPLLNPEGAVVYSTAYQSDPSLDVNKNYRQWWYQKCTELAYFQNAPAQNAIRSQWVNMSYHEQHCADLFDTGVWPPPTDVTNYYYGSVNIAATNVVYAQGSQDPWQRAGVQQTISPSQPEVTITCVNCGHCVDLRGCPGGCAAGNNLDEARLFIRVMLEKWLAL